MPLYEYRCGGCGETFEIVQSMNARAEDTVCPHCRAKNATRLMSGFASKIVGTHKPGFSEMKAYDMLNERMHKFSKLPSLTGKRKAPPPPNVTGPGSPSSGDSGGTS